MAREFNINQIKLREQKRYLPVQILGNKKILRTITPMTIAQCKEHIELFPINWKWELLEFN